MSESERLSRVFLLRNLELKYQVQPQFIVHISIINLYNVNQYNNLKHDPSIPTVFKMVAFHSLTNSKLIWLVYSSKMFSLLSWLIFATLCFIYYCSYWVYNHINKILNVLDLTRRGTRRSWRGRGSHPWPRGLSPTRCSNIPSLLGPFCEKTET